MDTSVIPKGIYCYFFNRNTPCPYWSLCMDKPYQENGFCSYLNQGDWEREFPSLLWDQVKECGINRDIDEEDLTEDTNSLICIEDNKIHVKGGLKFNRNEK